MTICDTSSDHFKPYQYGGIARQVKSSKINYFVSGNFKFRWFDLFSVNWLFKHMFSNMFARSCPSAYRSSTRLKVRCLHVYPSILCPLDCSPAHLSSTRPFSTRTPDVPTVCLLSTRQSSVHPSTTRSSVDRRSMSVHLLANLSICPSECLIVPPSVYPTILRICHPLLFTDLILSKNVNSSKLQSV